MADTLREHHAQAAHDVGHGHSPPRPWASWFLSPCELYEKAAA